jgi:glycerate-2-kinase
LSSPDPSELLRALFEAPRAGEDNAGAGLHAIVAQRARERQMAVLDLGVQPHEEAASLCRVLAAIALQGVRHGRAAVPTLILSSGEVRWERRPAGAAQFLLALAAALDAHAAIYGLAAQGPWPAQGGGGSEAPAAFFFGPDTLARSQQMGMIPLRALASGQAAALFERLQSRMPFAWDVGGTTVVRGLLLA